MSGPILLVYNLDIYADRPLDDAKILQNYNEKYPPQEGQEQHVDVVVEHLSDSFPHEFRQTDPVFLPWLHYAEQVGNLRTILNYDCNNVVKRNLSQEKVLIRFNCPGSIVFATFIHDYSKIYSLVHEDFTVPGKVPQYPKTRDTILQYEQQIIAERDSSGEFQNFVVVTASLDPEVQFFTDSQLAEIASELAKGVDEGKRVKIIAQTIFHAKKYLVNRDLQTEPLTDQQWSDLGVQAYDMWNFSFTRTGLNTKNGDRLVWVAPPEPRLNFELSSGPRNVMGPIPIIDHLNGKFINTFFHTVKL